MNSKVDDNVLFMLHPTRGHINAFKRIINYSKSKYKSTIICCSPCDQELFHGLDLPIVQIESLPFGTGFESIMAILEGQYKFSNDLFLRKSKTLFIARFNSVSKLLFDTKPDLIFLDTLWETDLYILHDIKRIHNLDFKIIVLRTKPNLWYSSESIPNSTYSYSSFKSVRNIQWVKHYFLRVFLRIKDYFLFQGQDDYSLLQYGISKLTYSKELKRRSSTYLSVSNFVTYYPEIVLLPIHYEFPNFVAADNSLYIGFQYDEPIFKEDFDSIQFELEEKKRNGFKIIYISFGTLHLRYADKLNKLLRKLHTALNEIESVHVYLAIKGGKMQFSYLFNDPNWTVENFLPQSKLLKSADVIISHGGINSIKEAIMTMTPMYLFPLNPKWDQPGNAARIENHGLGERGRLHHSTNCIKTKLKGLIADKSYYNNLKFFADKMKTESMKDIELAIRECKKIQPN